MVGKRAHPEDNLQMACLRYFDLRFPKLRMALHHSPNGGRRDEREGARFKLMGVRPGFPDLILLFPRGKCPFLGIEMKSARGYQTEHQKEYQRYFESIGARYEIVRTKEQFISVVEDYLLNKSYKDETN